MNLINISDLISGKVYRCYLKSFKIEHKLFWSTKKISSCIYDISTTKSSIFIFLDKTVKINNIDFDIKGLVDGKLLYAPQCGINDFGFEELE